MAPPSLVQSSSSKLSMSIQPNGGERFSTTTVASGGSVPKDEQQERKGKVNSSGTTTGEDGVLLPGGQTAGGEGLNGQNGANGGGHGKKLWSYDEISRHRSEDDAWIVVDGQVYDVTPFLETHPGGPEVTLAAPWIVVLLDSGA